MNAPGDLEWGNLPIANIKTFNARVNAMLEYRPEDAGLKDWTRWRSILARGHGACLDFAIVKLGLLRDDHGFQPEQLALVITDRDATNRDHAWLAVRLPWAVVRLDWKVSVISIG